jgi:hypothetical protein
MCYYIQIAIFINEFKFVNTGLKYQLINKLNLIGFNFYN